MASALTILSSGQVRRFSNDGHRVVEIGLSRDLGPDDIQVVRGVWGRDRGATLAWDKDQLTLSGVTGSERLTTVKAGPFTLPEQDQINAIAKRCSDLCNAAYWDKGTANWFEKPSNDETPAKSHLASIDASLSLIASRGASLTVVGPVGKGTFFTECFGPAPVIATACQIQNKFAQEDTQLASNFRDEAMRILDVEQRPASPITVLASEVKWRNYPGLVKAAKDLLGLDGGLAAKSAWRDLVSSHPSASVEVGAGLTASVGREIPSVANTPKLSTGAGVSL